MPILIIGHTEASLKVHPAGLGENVHGAKLQSSLSLALKKEVERLDLYDLFGNFDAYETLALLNYALAQEGNVLIEKSGPLYESIYKQIEKKKPDVMLFLTWNWGTAALFGTGIHRLCPVVSKLYAFHSNEIVMPSLYAKSDLIVTESLLGNQRGIAYGIPASKMLYLPHTYPSTIDTIPPDPTYLERLAHLNGKQIKRGPQTVVIGIASRLQARKNCGYVLTALAKLFAAGRDFLCVLKGDVEGSSPAFSEAMEVLQKQPWFLWDRENTPFPDVLRQYAAFDLCVNLSGYEGASNTVVEMLALGKPVLVLDGTTNPYLFKEGAYFIKAQEELVLGAMPYQVPDEKDLYETLDAFIQDPALRLEWSKRAKKVAEKRFSPERMQKRLSLVIEAAKEYRENNFRLQTEIERLYHEECALYGVT